ncbi:MAG: hypothetical protein JNL42_08870 [Anaerolineae bacterium]|nr:hypothetical protein [Anaerolineae bacterium]
MDGVTDAVGLAVTVAEGVAVGRGVCDEVKVGAVVAVRVALALRVMVGLLVSVGTTVDEGVAEGTGVSDGVGLGSEVKDAAVCTGSVGAPAAVGGGSVATTFWEEGVLEIARMMAKMTASAITPRATIAAMISPPTSRRIYDSGS